MDWQTLHQLKKKSNLSRQQIEIVNGFYISVKEVSLKKLCTRCMLYSKKKNHYRKHSNRLLGIVSG